MKNFISTYVKAIYSGIMIGFGGIVYLSVDNKVIGAFLFSFGLLTIVNQKFNLYTGKIGFVSSRQEAVDIPIIILGNLTGTWIMAELSRLAALNISATELWEKKLNNTPRHLFVLAIFCGILMYLAIDNNNKSGGKQLFVILPVMIFILSGFEHSVADMFYMCLARAYDKKSILYLLVIMLGNGVGAVIFHNFRRLAQNIT